MLLCLLNNRHWTVVQWNTQDKVWDWLFCYGDGYFNAAAKETILPWKTLWKVFFWFCPLARCHCRSFTHFRESPGKSKALMLGFFLDVNLHWVPGMRLSLVKRCLTGQSTRSATPGTCHGCGELSRCGLCWGTWPAETHGWETLTGNLTLGKRLTGKEPRWGAIPTISYPTLRHFWGSLETYLRFSTSKPRF